MPEYQCSPLWTLNSDNFFEPVELDVLALPFFLVTRIKEWKELFDKTYDSTNPAASGFKNEIELKAFEKEGVKIWMELASLLPDDTFVFFSVKNNQLYSLISEYNAI